MSVPTDFNDRMLSLGLARVSEAAAMASAGLIGRGDEKAADQAAVNAMRDQLNKLDIKGVVVIGEGERDEAPMLFIGEEVGTGNGPAVDIALDPLEGTTLTAKDMPNALTVIAMAPRGTLLHAPDVYMDKLAIGPGYKPGTVTLAMSPAERVSALAAAKGCVDRGHHRLHPRTPPPRGDDRRGPLHRRRDPADHRRRRGRRHALRRARPDRHRHVHGLGRRARRGAGGGGAEMHGRADLRPAPVPQRRRARPRRPKAGITNLDRVYTRDDMVTADVIFAATGVTDGSLLPGIKREPAG
jgi:fructose-1,6-bisphosphatase II / sedoheptulose-1,7-bisphosphatase